MADSKVSALTADTTVDPADLGMTIEDPSGTPVSKKATWLNILKGALLGLLTSDGDLVTRTSGAAARITRASLAADSAFSSLYAANARVGCGLFRSGARSFANAGESVPWDAEDFDTDGFHESVTNPARITIPTGKDGLYLFTSGLAAGVVGTANKNWIHSVGKNGTTIKGSGVNQLQSTSINTFSNVAVIVRAVAGDYFTADLYQDSGSSQAMDLAQCSFICSRLSP